MSTVPMPIWLASTSPRRRELLAAVLGPEGEAFAVVDPGIDDADLPMGGRAGDPTREGESRAAGTRHPSLAQWVASLAFLKARAGARAARADDALVIGADTLVDQDGEVLSKPRDAADAARMIRLVRGRSHRVLTGVAIVHPSSGLRDVYTEQAVVHVGMIDEEAVERYAAGNAWRGKSGGYNLQERLDDGWPLRVEGDPGCVTGLPTLSLPRRLASMAARCAAAGVVAGGVSGGGA